ncbi:MAG TPA: hypothetical protein VJ761_12675, partial [Ktedonobacteraceae bacterium]|nr:hypothetical protein [Ktedonobacteraceae bacterium]
VPVLESFPVLVPQRGQAPGAVPTEYVKQYRLKREQIRCITILSSSKKARVTIVLMLLIFLDV